MVGEVIAWGTADLHLDSGLSCRLFHLRHRHDHQRLFRSGGGPGESSHRPLPSGRISTKEVMILALLFSAAGLIAAGLLGPIALALALVMWIMSNLYNWRYKETGLFGNMMVASAWLSSSSWVEWPWADWTIPCSGPLPLWYSSSTWAKRSRAELWIWRETASDQPGALPFYTEGERPASFRPAVLPICLDKHDSIPDGLAWKLSALRLCAHGPGHSVLCLKAYGEPEGGGRKDEDPPAVPLDHDFCHRVHSCQRCSV